MRGFGHAPRCAGVHQELEGGGWRRVSEVEEALESSILERRCHFPGRRRKAPGVGEKMSSVVAIGTERGEEKFRGLETGIGKSHP